MRRSLRRNLLRRQFPSLLGAEVGSGVGLASGLGQFYRCGARVCPTPMDPPEYLSRWGQQVHCLRAIHYRKAGNNGKWMSSLPIRSTRIVTLAPSNRRVPGQVLDGRPAVCMHLQGEGEGKLQALLRAFIPWMDHGHGATSPNGDRGQRMKLPFKKKAMGAPPPHHHHLSSPHRTSPLAHTSHHPVTTTAP